MCTLRSRYAAFRGKPCHLIFKAPSETVSEFEQTRETPFFLRSNHHQYVRSIDNDFPIDLLNRRRGTSRPSERCVYECTYVRMHACMCVFYIHREKKKTQILMKKANSTCAGDIHMTCRFSRVGKSPRTRRNPAFRTTHSRRL